MVKKVIIEYWYAKIKNDRVVAWILSDNQKNKGMKAINLDFNSFKLWLKAKQKLGIYIIFEWRK